MSDNDYARGWHDGHAGRDPDPDRLAYGANHCNDYEIGYLDSAGPPRRWPDGWAIPNVVAVPPETTEEKP